MRLKVNYFLVLDHYYSDIICGNLFVNILSPQISWLQVEIVTTILLPKSSLYQT